MSDAPDLPLCQRPVNILLAVDGSEHALAAIALLNDLPLLPGSQITALSVLSNQLGNHKSILLSALDQTQMLLREKGLQVKTGLLHGDPADCLRSYADEHTPDLLIFGAKGLRATFDILLGGVAQHLVEQAHWPVLVVRAPYTGLKHILMATDGSACSEQALNYLVRFPLPGDSQVILLHVLPAFIQTEMMLRGWPTGIDAYLPEPTREMEELARRQAKEEEDAGRALLDRAEASVRQVGIPVSSFMKRGDAATEIIEHIKTHKIDLVVTGSRGISPVRSWLLGSVSRKLVHYSGCSAMIVK